MCNNRASISIGVRMSFNSSKVGFQEKRFGHPLNYAKTSTRELCNLEGGYLSTLSRRIEHRRRQPVQSANRLANLGVAGGGPINIDFLKHQNLGTIVSNKIGDHLWGRYTKSFCKP